MAWDLLSQKQAYEVPIRSGIPVSSFDLFDDGIVAAAGAKLFLRGDRT